MWYVATPDALTATFNHTGIYGVSPDMGKYQVGFVEADSNESPTYYDLRNNSVTYNATYFYALTLENHDTYNPKQHYFMEVHDEVGHTPHHLFD